MPFLNKKQVYAKRLRYRVKLSNGTTINVRKVPTQFYWFTFDGINYRWESAISAKHFQRIESVIERKFPDYYHKPTVNGKHDKANCPACQRKSISV